MKLPRICLHFKPITLLSIPRSHCLLPNIPQRLVGIFLLFVARGGLRENLQIGSEDKAAAPWKQRRNLELFGHKGAVCRGATRGQEACKRGLVSTSHYVGHCV